MSNWIEDNLFFHDGTADYYEPGKASCFEKKAILYSVRLGESFVDTIMKGVAEPCSFDYRSLFSSVSKLTGRNSATLFYVTNPDNCMSLVEFERPFRLENPFTHELQVFETNPAQQGGVSSLGVLSLEYDWLINHEFCPLNDFTIELYSSKALGEKLLSALGIPEARDLR